MGIAIAISGFILALVIVSCGGGLTTEEVVKDIQGKASNIVTYKAAWMGVTYLKGQEVKASGTVSFKRPRYMRITSVDSFGGELLMFFDGNNIWHYLPKEAIAYKYPQKEEDIYKAHLFGEGWGIPCWPFKGIEKDMKYLYSKTIKGEDLYVLEIITESQRPELATVSMPIRTQVFVRVKDGVIQKIISYDAQGKEIGFVEFKDVQINIAIPDSVFVFIPPKGVKVVEVME